MSYEFADGYKIRDQTATHFLTFSIMGWIDVFSRQRYRDIILEISGFVVKKEKSSDRSLCDYVKPYSYHLDNR